MPRKKINRSQAIRDYLAKNAGASVGEIKEALAKKGIKASDSLINAVKYRKAGRKGKRRRGRPRGRGLGQRHLDRLAGRRQATGRSGRQRRGGGPGDRGAEEVAGVGERRPHQDTRYVGCSGWSHGRRG